MTIPLSNGNPGTSHCCHAKITGYEVIPGGSQEGVFAERLATFPADFPIDFAHEKLVAKVENGAHVTILNASQVSRL